MINLQAEEHREKQTSQQLKQLELLKCVTRHRQYIVCTIAYLATTVDAKHLECVKTVCPIRPILPHVIQRSNIYDDVLNLFCNKEALKEYPLKR